jgi:hypothetical protein
MSFLGLVQCFCGRTDRFSMRIRPPVSHKARPVPPAAMPARKGRMIDFPLSVVRGAFFRIRIHMSGPGGPKSCGHLVSFRRFNPVEHSCGIGFACSHVASALNRCSSARVRIPIQLTPCGRNSSASLGASAKNRAGSVSLQSTSKFRITT